MKIIIFLLALLFLSCSDNKNFSQTNPLFTETKFKNIYEDSKYMIVDTGLNYCLIQDGSGLKAVSLNTTIETKKLSLASWYLEEYSNTFKIRNAATGCYMHAEYDSAVTVESVLVGWWSSLWNIWVYEDDLLWLTDRWRQNSIYLSSSDITFQYTREPKFIWKLQTVADCETIPFLEDNTDYKIVNDKGLYISEDINSKSVILTSNNDANSLWFSKKVPSKNGKEVYQFFNSRSKNILTLNGASVITSTVNDSLSYSNWILTDESGEYTIRDEEKNYFLAADSLGKLVHIEKRDKWRFVK